MSGKGFRARKMTEDEERLIKARADKVELEVELKRGDLIPAGDVEKEWVSMALSFRNKILALPTSLAQELADETNPRAVEKILKDSIFEALSELAMREEA